MARLNKKFLIVYGGAVLILALLFISATRSPAQVSPPMLQIVSPPDGTVVSPGQTISVRVEPSVGGTFTGMIIVGENPLGTSNGLTAPPWEFSLQIPLDITPGTYRITAFGGTGPGRDRISSNRIRLFIEKSEPLIKLNVQPPRIQFRFVGDQRHLNVTGTFSDGSLNSLSSSTHTTFISDNPSIAFVDSRGVVTAMKAGATTVHVQNGGQSFDVRVTVPSTIPGDLDGDNDVDQEDVNEITAALNTPAHQPFDPRDLDKDSVITALDARKLILLCTRPRCATQ